MPSTRRAPFYLSLLAGILIVLASVYGFHLLRSRPGLPEGIEDADIIRIDGLEIRGPGGSPRRNCDLELALAGKTIGDGVTIQVRRGADTETLRAQIIPFYSKVPFPTIYLVIGVLSFLIGFLALVFRWEDPKARILYWLAAVFSLCVIVSGGTYCLRSSWTTYVPMVLFYLFYPLAPALLVHFSFTFLNKSRTPALALVYGISLLLGSAFTVLILLAMHRLSTDIFWGYATLFTVFRGYLVTLLFLAIFTFIRAYRRAPLQESRAQIKWIFLGVVLGLAPFIFLYQLPRFLGWRAPLTEDAAAIPFIFAPLGLALAIFRFRFLDVEIIINRSLVYSLLTVLTAGVYLFSVAVFQDLPVRLFAMTETAVSLGSALLAAIVFQPARRWIQSLVDRAFFRKSYDYKLAILKFNDDARFVPGQAELVDNLTAHIQTVLPVERLSVTVGTVVSGERKFLYPEHEETNACSSLLSLLPPGRVCARRESVSTEEGVDFSRDEALKTHRWEMAFPLPFGTAVLTGCMFLGKKRSGQRFTAEDIELLHALATDLSLNLERLRLQEEVIYERAAKEKLDELNRLKTEFVSTVSHELRTPLTSIQGLSEILEAGKVTDPGAREEIHHALAAESARLSRLLHNILDFGKIEQQAKEYVLRAEDLGLIIRDLVRVFRPQLEAGGFAVDLKLPPHPVLADVDRDAIEQLMVNLIDNAMKYSTNRKHIGIDLLEKPDTCEICVRDQGIGIAPGEMDRIFGNFYRGSRAAQVNPKGVGLGLKIVRHIVEAHRGEILVDSRPSEGSAFRVIFPRSKSA
jgi:signal transduction histidine kinase